MFTRDDRKWLRSIEIDPEPTAYEVMFDALSDTTMMLPSHIIISQELARKVLAEFGELTIETVWAYRKKFQA